MIPLIKEYKITRDCLRSMKAEGFKTKYRVGFVIKDIVDLISYKEGRILLFQKSNYSDDITVERAMTKEEMDYQKSRGSALRTTGTMVGVPRYYVKDITFLFKEIL